MSLNKESNTTKKAKMIFKVCLAGEPDVGKKFFLDSLFKSDFAKQQNLITKNSFINAFDAELIFHDIEIADIICNLQFWYLHGKPKLENIRKAYFSGTSIVFLLFDASRRETITNICSWIDMFDPHSYDGYLVYVTANNTGLGNENVEENIRYAKEVCANRSNVEHLDIRGKSSEELYKLIQLKVSEFYENNV